MNIATGIRPAALKPIGCREDGARVEQALGVAHRD